MGGAPAGGAPAAAAPKKKKGGCIKVIIILLVIFLVLAIAGGITGYIMCASFFSTLTPNGATISRNIGSTTTTIGDRPESPYVDYTFTPEEAGTYVINLSSTEMGADPYLIVLQGETQLAQDDDGGGGLNSMITHAFEANVEYTVRAANLGPIDSGAMFSISCTGPTGAPAVPTGLIPPVGGVVPPATPPAGTPPATPPAGGGGGTGCAALEACCGANPTMPQAPITCGQLATFRSMPAGSDQACDAALQGLRNAATATSQTLPAACNP